MKNSSHEGIGNYDGQLVAVLDRKLDEDFKLAPSDIVFVDQNSKAHPLAKEHSIEQVQDVVFHRRLKTLTNYLFAELPRSSIGRYSKHNHKAVAEELFSLLPNLPKEQKQILKVILEGKIALNILLNSPGGSPWYKGAFSNAGEWIKGQGGVVRCFAASEVQSAAAMLFIEGDERYALHDTDFMLHTRDPSNKEKTTTRDIDRDKWLLRKYILDIVPPDREHEVDALFDRADADPQNPRSEIWFNDPELQRFNIATSVLGSVNELRQKFTEVTGISVNATDCGDNGIERYFYLAGIEEAVRKIPKFSDFKVRLYLNDKGKITTPCPAFRRRREERGTEKKSKEDEYDCACQAARFAVDLAVGDPKAKLFKMIHEQ